MADYWIKLYHEITDDPKMATLPDRLWRRTIELFLLAGKLCADKSGKLPDTRQLAWLLRMNTDDLQTDLDQLVATGIIQPIPNGWLVVNFQKRQSAATSTERVKQHRERKHERQYYGNETDLKRNVTQINRLTESETETETEQNTGGGVDYDLGSISTVYEKNFGVLTPMLVEAIKDDLGQYGLQACLDAMNESLKNNVRKWSYVHGILTRRFANGNKATANKARQPERVQVILPDGTITEALT